MDYKYDVFFSYTRDPLTDGWHRAVMEKLKYWLKQELNKREVSVFFDTEDIRTGARWRIKLADALKSSKTMICVWSPLYFQSPWCVSEWKTFAVRESQYDRELIVPVSYHDGDCFPREAKAKQMLDLSNYTSTAFRFWETEIAVEFETKCLKRFAKDVAALVRMAPLFDSTFAVVEVREEELSPPPDIGRIAFA